MKLLTFFLMSSVALAVPLQSAKDFINDAIAKSIANGNLTIAQDAGTLSAFADIIASSNITLDNELAIYGNVTEDIAKKKTPVRWNFTCLLDHFRGSYCHYWFLDEKRDNKLVKDWQGFFHDNYEVGSWKTSNCGTRLITYGANGAQLSDIIGDDGWDTIPLPWAKNIQAYVSWW